MMRACLCVILIMFFAACSPNELDISLADLPPGDAERGAELFTQSINGAPACTGCHSRGSSNGVGPGLDGYVAVAGSRVDGDSPQEYTFYSIVWPARYRVRGFSNTMYNKYADKLSPQDIADLIAYMLSLT